MKSYFMMWRKIADYRTRSTRADFWGALFWILFIVGIFSVFDYLYLKVLWYPFALAGIHIIPLFPLVIRRFHDVGHSGVWALALILPFIAITSFLVYYHYFDDGTGMYYSFHDMMHIMLGLFALNVVCCLIVLRFLWGESSEGENLWGISPAYEDETDENDENDENDE